jgi:peptide/nickel transport system ATP-binding protein
MSRAEPRTPPASSSAAVLEVRDLSKTFVSGGLKKTTVTAVDDVSFTVPRGSVVALVGESGSGKSTIARLIARLDRPTSGQFLLNGQDVLLANRGRTSRQYRRDVQMIFQDPFGSINPAHTVGHAIARPLINNGTTGSGVPERINELLETVGLNPGHDFADKYPHELSGGQRQRVAIARALATSPRLILADEPTSMLDVSIRMGILNLLSDLRDGNDLSYLYITHDLASARYISEEILVMYRGRLVEGGPTEEIISRAAHPYTRLLLSSVPDPYRQERADLGRTVDRAALEICPWPALSGTTRDCPPADGRHLVSTGHWIYCPVPQPA